MKTSMYIIYEPYNIIIKPITHLQIHLRVGKVDEYRSGMHRLDVEHCKLSAQSRHSQLLLDEMHPKIDTHPCLSMEFERVDM